MGVGGRRAGWQFYCRAIWLKGNGFVVVVVVFSSCVLFTKATRLSHIPQLSNGFLTYCWVWNLHISLLLLLLVDTLWFLGQGRKCCKVLTDFFLSPWDAPSPSSSIEEVGSTSIDIYHKPLQSPVCMYVGSSRYKPQKQNWEHTPQPPQTEMK